MYLEIILKKVNDVPGKSTVAFFDVGTGGGFLITIFQLPVGGDFSFSSRLRVTTIGFDVKDKTRVSLRIKDVAIPKEYIINQ